MSKEIKTIECRGKYIAYHLLLDGSGTHHMNVDGSGADKEFYRSPPAGKKWIIRKAMIKVENVLLQNNNFGGVDTLPNGCLSKVKEDGVERNLWEFAINSNADLLEMTHYAYSCTAGTDLIIMVWNFEADGSSLQLCSSCGDCIKFIVQDNLTGMSDFQVVIKGYEEDE